MQPSSLPFSTEFLVRLNPAALSGSGTQIRPCKQELCIGNPVAERDLDDPSP
jgi:hypothetical protein